MDEVGAYTREVGNVGEGLALQMCVGLSENTNHNPTVLVLGGSPYFWADLLLAGRSVVFVYREQNTLRYVRRQLAQLLSDTKIVARQFRIVCRPLESDISDLAADASAVAVVGLLHHLAQPRVMLSQLLCTGKPLVLLDTTSELMEQTIAEDGRLYGHICDEHFVCRDAARKVGFNTKADILGLLKGKDCARWPQVVAYPLPCCWCHPDMPCGHRGRLAWLAAWEGV